MSPQPAIRVCMMPRDLNAILDQLPTHIGTAQPASKAVDADAV